MTLGKITKPLPVEVIESIVFNEVGSMLYQYRLKKVEVTSPMQNVHGLIRIDNNYYKKVQA